MELKIAAARFALGKLSSEQLVALASATLDRGIYTDAVGLLAYEEPIWSGVRPLFERALSELGIPIPSREHACRTLAREYPRQILDGEVTPYEGAREIWWDVANENGADESLRSFVGMASEWEDDPAHRSDYEAMILEEARELFASGDG